MSANFPTSLDTYTTKASGNTIQAAHVNDLQDAVSALEAKVGADGSSVAASHTKKIADILTILGSCTTADLTKLHDLTATALELNIMDGVTATAAEINKLDADNLTTGDLLTKGASALEVISAVAATQYLKSAGVGAKPAYSKLALRDTGVKVVGFSHTRDEGTGNQQITGVGFTPSVAIIFWVESAGGITEGRGVDTVSTRGCCSRYSANVKANTTYSINDYDDYYRATIASFNSDGCTINWSKNDVNARGNITGFILFLP